MKSILFFDDWMVEHRDSLERVWGRPRFVKEMFQEFYPGFLGYAGYISAFYDANVGRYVLYLAIIPPKADPTVFVTRLESDDPYNWEAPAYDTSVTPAWKGFQNVVVDQAGERFWPFSVFPLAGTPLADKGYVAAEWVRPGGMPKMESQIQGVSAIGYAKDGITFAMDRDNPWRRPGADAPGNFVWNEQADLFHIYTRSSNVDRRIDASTSPDLQTFSPRATVIHPDALDRVGTEFYDMPVRPYEDLFVGFLHVQTVDHYETNRIKMTGRMETELAHSYNGTNWYRPNREPFLPLRDYGQQGGGQVFGHEMIRTSDDKLLFIASGSKGDHAAYPDMQAAGMDTTGYFGPLMYEMRLDGFCSLKTYARDGLLRTKTLIPRSKEFSVNVLTTAHTAIRVRLLDGETAEPIPGYDWEQAAPISGDHLFAPVRWTDREDLAELVGRPLRIEIQMREAQLFAIRLEHDAFYSTLPIKTLH
jgi:hypothetical protein